MTRWGAVFIAAAVIAVAGCGGGRAVPPEPEPEQPQPLWVTVSAPDSVADGEAADWEASWTGGTPPYTVAWDFGGGAENIEVVAEGSPDDRRVTHTLGELDETREFAYLVTVRDSLGAASAAGGTYTVLAPPPPKPSIDEVDFAGGWLTVTVSEPQGHDVLVWTSELPGLLCSPRTVLVQGGNGTAKFLWLAEDQFRGAGGTALVVADAPGVQDQAEQLISIPPLELAPDTLYALPLVRWVNAGEPVRIACATGPMARPFFAINMISLTLDDDAVLVPLSLNPGAPGGASTFLDGYWAGLSQAGVWAPGDPVPPMPDNHIPEGRTRWSFTIIGGSNDTTRQGMLFNFAVTFSEPGVKRIGFQEFDEVNRTYYCDNDLLEYFWGTLMADEYASENVTGVDNLIVVR